MDLKKDFFDISNFCLPMIIRTFFSDFRGYLWIQKLLFAQCPPPHKFFLSRFVLYCNHPLIYCIAIDCLWQKRSLFRNAGTRWWITKHSCFPHHAHYHKVHLRVLTDPERTIAFQQYNKALLFSFVSLKLSATFYLFKRNAT